MNFVYTMPLYACDATGQSKSPGDAMNVSLYTSYAYLAQISVKVDTGQLLSGVDAQAHATGTEERTSPGCRECRKPTVLPQYCIMAHVELCVAFGHDQFTVNCSHVVY